MDPPLDDVRRVLAWAEVIQLHRGNELWLSDPAVLARLPLAGTLPSLSVVIEP